MTQVNAQISEKRCAERMKVGEIVQYRLNSDDAYRDATMEDFSTSGMFLLMAEQYPEGTAFEVRVKPDENSDEAMCFKVHSVRINPCTDIELYGYGCAIDEYQYE